MKETILLIEDEVELQQNLKEILEFNGFSVFTADNGEDALNKIEDQEIDLILCDIMMPSIDGHQFLKIIRSRINFQQTPFIFLSAKASQEDKAKGFLEGADDYLVKPIPARVLLNSVFNLLAEKKLKESLTTKRKEEDRIEGNSFSRPEIETSASYLISILELIKKSQDSSDKDEVSRLLDLAMSSARSIQSSCEKVILFRNLTELSPAPVPVVLDDLILPWINKIGEENFSYKSDPTENPVFDLSQMKFVIKELMENSIKFNSNSGIIQIDWLGGKLSFKNKQSAYQWADKVPTESFSPVNGGINECSGLGLGLFLVKEICRINHAEFQWLIDPDFTAKIIFKKS